MTYDINSIDWTDEACSVGDHFNVKDAIYLPSWGRLANESDGLDDTIKTNLLALFAQMDAVRNFFSKPIHVHVSYRPVAYNQQIGGALHSAHSEGKACDFDVIGVDCDTARSLLEPKLEEFGMRMEKMPLPKGTWVHLDIRDVPAGGHRYFIP